MRYLGGKMRQGAKIVAAIAADSGTPRVWVEPFSGALGSGRAAMIAFPDARFVFNDNNPALFTMWTRLMEGWEPPSEYINKTEYERARANQDPDDPLTAFIGFGYSYGGKFFAGYAKQNVNMPGAHTDHGPYNATMRKAALLIARRAVLSCGEFDQTNIPAFATVYYDPPYSNRTKQHKRVQFVDPNRVQEHARGQSGACYASEFGPVFRGKVVLNLGNTDMLVNGGDKKNPEELLVRLI